MTGPGSRRPGSHGTRGPGASRTRRAGSTAAATPTTGAPSPPTGRSGWRHRLSAARRDQRIVRYAALCATVLLVAVLLAPTLHAWFDQRSAIGDLESKVAAQRADVSRLQEEQKRWQDEAFVEQQARARLMFVKPGEKSYIVLDATKPRGIKGMADGTTSTHVPWYGTLWSSLRAADEPSAQDG